MAFQVSPGVNVSEIDLTTIVPSQSTTDGALAGVFVWGPLNEIVLLENEDLLVKAFGKPTSASATSFFLAANFLAYGNKLRLVRVADESAALNACSSGVGHLIQNDVAYEQLTLSSLTNGQFAAKYAGVLGNSLKVAVCPSEEAFDQTLAGTIDTTGTAVVGTDTSFVTTLAVGSFLISSSGESKRVTAITDATHATIASAFSADLSDATCRARWEYADSFGLPPKTSADAASKLCSKDELHIAIIDEDGLFPGSSAGQILEKYAFVSKLAGAKDASGNNNCYRDVLNRQSALIRFLAVPAAGAGNWLTSGSSITFAALPLPLHDSLAGGADGSSTVDAADFIRGYDLFKNAEAVDISLVLVAHETSSVLQAISLEVIGNICESRKDCIAIISPPKSACVNNVGHEVADIVTFRNLLPDTSYAVLDSGWKYQYDKYNDLYRWVPLAGDTAGLCVRTDTERDPWYSPAGFNRGNIKNVIKLAWNPNKAERDDLYVKSVNPVVTFPGLGTVLYGDKTLLSRPSAFDRINVRRLFIVLEKSISTAAKFTLFEFNDAFTREGFKNLVEPYLRDVQSRRGIYDFRVVCDERNNTPEVIDRNEFVGDIYIKPARSINFIQLNFIAVRTGVDFNELTGVQV